MGCEMSEKSIELKECPKETAIPAKGGPEGPPVKSSQHSTHQQQVSQMLQSLNEFLAILFYVSIPGTLLPAGLLLAGLAWYSVFVRYLLVLYLGWIYVIDSQSAYNGGWKLNAFENYFRSLSVWDHYKAYFRARLLKEEELDPSKNYILCCHPHVSTDSIRIKFALFDFEADMDRF
jgi:hypothetical protein